MHRIYVPSKGRSDTITTADLLHQSGLDFFVVVEPGIDEEHYKARFGSVRVLVLEQANQGIAYARNFCKQHSIACGDIYHWQLDDDIRSFLLRTPGLKTRTISAANALGAIEAEVAKYSNVARAGTNQNSWPPGSSAIKVNRSPEQCNLTRNDAAATFRGSICVDLDYSLQLLSAGWCTIVHDHIRTNCPAIGTNRGGLYDVYHDAVASHSEMNYLCARFPPMTVEIDEKGPHLRRNRIWSTFKQQLKLI